MTKPFDLDLHNAIKARITDVLEDLQIQKDFCENPYKNPEKRFNLLTYLMNVKDKEFMVIGEAPGYRGCNQTGVPFCSKQILEKIGNDYKRNFKIDSIPDEFYRENTASIIWGQFIKYDFYPVLWNVFPLHPHDFDNPLTNRKPTKREIKSTEILISNLIDIFETKVIICVGKTAKDFIKDFLPPKTDIQIIDVRHPSFGGANKFRTQFEAIMGVYFP